MSAELSPSESLSPSQRSPKRSATRRLATLSASALESDLHRHHHHHHRRPSKSQVPDSVPVPEGLKSLKIAVIGPHGGGKTSLISSFVNSFCPTVPAATAASETYYKALHLPLTSSLRNPSQSLTTPRSQKSASPHALHASKPDSPVAGGGSPSSDVGRTAPLPVFVQIEDSAPAPPLRLTQGMMGFLVVFDMTSSQSLQDASAVCRSLHDALEHVQPRPVVHLVGNKMDLASSHDTMSTLKRQEDAKEFAESEGISFKTVSASEFRQVRQVFQQLLREVYATLPVEEEPSAYGFLKQMDVFNVLGASNNAAASGAGAAAPVAAPPDAAPKAATSSCAPQ